MSVTLLPASRQEESGKRKINFAVQAPRDAKKVKVKASFKFPSRMSKEDDENGRSKGY